MQTHIALLFALCAGASIMLAMAFISSAIKSLYSNDSTRTRIKALPQKVTRVQALLTERDQLLANIEATQADQHEGRVDPQVSRSIIETHTQHLRSILKEVDALIGADKRDLHTHVIQLLKTSRASSETETR